MDASREERSPIAVSVEGGGVDWQRFAQLAREAQKRFRFIRGQPGDVSLRISDKPSRSLFVAERVEGVSVSTWQIEGICRYAGLEREAFFLTCGLVGLTCWRALTLNPLLISEDLWHREAGRCLFSRQTYREDYALVFENPEVCPGCRDFFRCLCVESEVFALQQALDFLFPMEARPERVPVFAAPGIAITRAVPNHAWRN